VKASNRVSILSVGILLAVLSGCNDTDLNASSGAAPNGFSQMDLPNDGGDGGNGPNGGNGGGGSDMDDNGGDEIGDHDGGGGYDCIEPKENEVLVCHVPPGNPAARHTICVGKPGAEHGHGLDLANPTAVGGHGGDTLGPCVSGQVAANEDQPGSED
jgi:hypothetical protein